MNREKTIFFHENAPKTIQQVIEWKKNLFYKSYYNLMHSGERCCKDTLIPTKHIFFKQKYPRSQLMDFISSSKYPDYNLIRMQNTWYFHYMLRVQPMAFTFLKRKFARNGQLMVCGSDFCSDPRCVYAKRRMYERASK